MTKLYMNGTKAVLAAIVLSIACQVSGQDPSPSYSDFPLGISVQYGLGNYSIKDKYISNEKYTGTLPFYSIGWTKGHDKYIYRLKMILRNSDQIDNYNVSTEITKLFLTQGFIYHLKERSLFAHYLNIWIGPSTEFLLNYNKPEIAVSGFDYAQSYAALVSLGLNVAAEYNLNHKLQLESCFSTTLVSMGFRTVDQEEDNRSPVKPLTLFSGMSSSLDLGVRYHLFTRLSVMVAYELDEFNINAWEKIISVSDNILIGLNYRFQK